MKPRLPGLPAALLLLAGSIPPPVSAQTRGFAPRPGESPAITPILHRDSGATGRSRPASTPPAASPRNQLGFSPEHRNVLLAEMYFAKARSARSRRDLEEATRELDKVLALAFPDTADAQSLLGGTWLLLGEIRLQQGHPREAEAAAREAVERSRSAGGLVLSESYKLLARLADQAGRTDEASRCRRLAMETLDAR